MPPNLHLRFLTLRTTTDQKADVTILDEGRYRRGRAMRWNGGVYQVEFGDEEVLKLLLMLSQNYTATAEQPRLEGRVARVELEILLEGDPAEGGRRIAEACRLLGVALGRIENGEAQGMMSDEMQERRVTWRSTGPGRGRGRGVA